jgi:1-hydroxycarotenoid 3,4-desaturase
MGMSTSQLSDRVVVIGAGIGGLAAALRLAAAGRDVLVIEAAGGPGGKMRTVPSAAGPVDAGPTVLTMRAVFEELFALAGAALEDHVTLRPLPVLARHFWPDGTTLDLFADHDRSAAAVRDFAGPKAEAGFRRFSQRAAALWQAFQRPVMQSARPDLTGILRAVLADRSIWRDLAPGATLARAAADCFADVRLAQLFGRYATYVGGTPFASPAVLALIWQAEALGVWTAQGGMQAVARAVATLAEARGAQFLYRMRAERIVVKDGRVAGVALSDGTTRPAGTVVFNGDAAALGAGLLGPAVRTAVPRRATHPRSHSAWVWAFAARPSGPELAYHNVFFARDPAREFAPLGAGRMQDDPTLYVCAQDRADGPPPGPAPERFEIIMNAAPTPRASAAPSDDEVLACATTTFGTLSRFGTTFDPPPMTEALTGPAQFAKLFPGSEGSLYGLSPHGTGAAFRRPSAGTRIPGLWIAGGGVHPGPGVPMAALSGMLAAQSILARTAPRALTLMSRQRAMPGGTSTASRTTEPARSR